MGTQCRHGAAVHDLLFTGGFASVSTLRVPSSLTCYMAPVSGSQLALIAAK